LLRKAVLVELFVNYKNSTGKTFQEIVFCRNTPSTAATEIRGLVLRLFAAGILIPAVDQNKRLYCDLARDNTATPVVNKDSSFNGIRLLPEDIPQAQ
jgi:hypothetical protein